MSDQHEPQGTGVLLAKIRPSGRLMGARGVDFEPLYEEPTPTSGSFGLGSSPQWYVVQPEEEQTPWDQAHSQVAAQLGIDSSDVLFLEPDFHQRLNADDEAEITTSQAFAVGEDCAPIDQDTGHGKATGDGFAWHLGSRFSQLGSAREEVQFTEPRTRIAHIDTGYWPEHETTPTGVNTALDQNFVEKDGNQHDASDPDNKRLILDNSGHGTGTLSILAGKGVSAEGNAVLGGAPDAEIVVLRIADSVVLLRTSAFVRALRYAARNDCAVASMSMGGLPSKAWAEAVDQAYIDGLCLCAAAGNRKGISPPKRMVYPARYERVIAVPGVMANGDPYKDLDGALEGSFGPKKSMDFALAAYTPNIPWAKFGCKNIVRLNGEGTSSATPQVAAAVALWIEKYKSVLPTNWRRVEAVRHALFSTAKVKSNHRHFGNGILQAKKALSVAPHLNLPMAGQSNNSWAFLRLLTGLGVEGPTPREEMFNLELAQRWLLREDLQEIVPDPEATSEIPQKKLREFMDAVIEDTGASLALRRHIAARYPMAGGQSPRRSAALSQVKPELPPVSIEAPEILDPTHRRLRVYAKDPSLAKQLDTADISEVTLDVRWEDTKRGPEGEYLKVIDNERSRRSGPYNYQGVDLNEPRLLAQDGWAPSEGNPQFHQQMVYAVAMKTIEHFERALGRPVQWRPRPSEDHSWYDGDFVKQLEIRPHAIQQANAYYSPNDVALLFGYFGAPARSGYQPGSPVYTCLSHDVIAHETTHAVLDGMHRRFNEPTNLDVLAFHEGFADLVALLQQFTIPELLEHQIATTRGDLETESLLGMLAVQLGQTSAGRGSLRSAIGHLEDGKWKRYEPDPNEIARIKTPHARGAILVGAVFDALIAIYNRRVADLLRLATGGTGVLPAGAAIHPDLARRLASEAAKTARHVLNMCIRALDYLPPVDVTFHDYLRAIITADFEMVSDDVHNYRVAFVESFSRRSIFPGDHDEQSENQPPALSVDTLRWPSFDASSVQDRQRRARRKKDLERKALSQTDMAGAMQKYQDVVRRLKHYADECMYLDDREALFRKTREERKELNGLISSAFQEAPAFRETLGLEEGSFEVHALRRALRLRPDGTATPQVIVSLTQSRTIPADTEKGTPKHKFRGGSTIVVDLTDGDLPKYVVVKDVLHRRRREATASFAREISADPVRRLFFGANEPFAALHELAEEER